MTKKEIRKHVALLVYAAGCSCCRDSDDWDEQLEILGKALDIPKYKDGSGRDFYTIAKEARA